MSVWIHSIAPPDASTLNAMTSICTNVYKNYATILMIVCSLVDLRRFMRISQSFIYTKLYNTELCQSCRWSTPHRVCHFGLMVLRCNSDLISLCKHLAKCIRSKHEQQNLMVFNEDTFYFLTWMLGIICLARLKSVIKL